MTENDHGCFKGSFVNEDEGWKRVVGECRMQFHATVGPGLHPGEGLLWLYLKRPPTEEEQGKKIDGSDSPACRGGWRREGRMLAACRAWDVWGGPALALALWGGKRELGTGEGTGDPSGKSLFSHETLRQCAQLERTTLHWHTAHGTPKETANQGDWSEPWGPSISLGSIFLSRSEGDAKQEERGVWLVTSQYKPSLPMA
jgi:hypothetical protein